MKTIVDLDSDVRILFSVSRYSQVKQCLFALLSAENSDNPSDFALGKCRFSSIPYSILKFPNRVHFLSLPIEGRGYWKYQDNVGLILIQVEDLHHMHGHGLTLTIWKPNILSVHSVSSLQALREPAAFSKPAGCETEVPYEKVTLAQARKGTPGKACKRHCVCVTVATSLCVKSIQAGNSKFICFTENVAN